MCSTQSALHCGADAEKAAQHARAASLVNPASGIANDFLNHFNEILLLVENLPILLPEMVEELMRWRPTTYTAYFTTSCLPGSAETLGTYASLAPATRRYFETKVDRLNQTALEIRNRIATFRRADGSIEPDDVTDFCTLAAVQFRAALNVVADFVNSGRVAGPDAVHDAEVRGLDTAA